LISRRLAIVIGIVIAALAISSLLVAILPKQEIPSQEKQGLNNGAFAANSQNHSVTIIAISANGSILPNAAYLITPNPYTGVGNYTVYGGSSYDATRLTPGIVTITGIREGNFTVTQIRAQSGYSLDKFSKVVEVKGGTAATAAFTDSVPNNVTSQNNIQQISSITYTAKFECGTISGGEGPLRPGHYDTDISLFNRQSYAIKVLWNAIINDGSSTNSMLKTLEPEAATGIVCKDLQQLVGKFDGEKMIEGFVVVRLQLEGVMNSLSNSGIAIIGQNVQPDLLDVQVFYTANSLEVLPHEVLVDKITFSILNDNTKKVPSYLLTKTLDISVPSNMNKISDPEMQVKKAIAQKYNITALELENIKIRVMNVSVGVGTMIDDHAISVTRVIPQFS